VFCILGANITGNLRAMLPYVTEAKIPLIESMASTTVATAPFNKYTFRPHVNHWYQAWMAADLAAGHFKHKRIALFNVTDQWGIETIKAVAIRLKEKWGIDPVVQAEADKAQTDVSAAILKIKNANPDCMISIGWPITIIPLLRQSYELGLTVPHIGTSSAGLAEVAAAGKYAKGYIAHLLTDEVMEGNDPRMKAFRENYLKTYPDTPKGIGRPDLWEADGYGIMKFIIDALGKTGSDLTREKFISQLEQTKNYRSVWQPFSFDSKNHEGIRKMRFYKVVDESGKREIITDWLGSDEILLECQKRSLKEYLPSLSQEYLDMVKGME